MIRSEHAMKTIAVALMTAVLPAVPLWAPSAKASDIDLSAWSCKQFQSASKEDVALILAWLDGYYRAEDDLPIVNTNQLAANAKKLDAYCATHPDVRLMTAADTLFEKE
jgi:acid stress chaperone HdeB